VGTPTRVVVAVVVMLLGLPYQASAQRDPFRDSFIDFHSALSGSYGDEGATAKAALDRMDASLTAWQQAQQKTEADLKSRNATPAELALFYGEAGRFNDAASAMAIAIAAEPNRASLYVFQGLLLEAARQRKEAIATFAQAARTDPADPVAVYLAARAADAANPAELQPLVTALMTASARPLRQKAPFMQLALIDDFSSREPVFSPAAYADGFASMAAGQFREAVSRFRDAMARDPLVVDPAGSHQQVLAGIKALREKRGPAAVEQLEAAVKALPDSAEAHRILGVVYRAVGRLPDSIRQLETAVRLAPGDERARVTLGSSLAETGKLPDAERVLRETIKALPASGQARWVLADVYDRMNRGLEAIAVLEEATSLTVMAGKAALYWRIAELAHRHQEFDRVVVALAERARLLPNEGHAHKDLGLALVRIGRDDEALVELLMTTLLGVEDVETLTAIGQIHLGAERFDMAETTLRRAVAADPKNSQAHYALGTTLMRVGKTAEGKQQLDEFQRLRAAALEEQRREFGKEPKPAGVSR
jgi:tetratricopeptide (TPR) repeat protein